MIRTIEYPGLDNSNGRRWGYVIKCRPVLTVPRCFVRGDCPREVGRVGCVGDVNVKVFWVNGIGGCVHELEAELFDLREPSYQPGVIDEGYTVKTTPLPDLLT